MDFPGAVAHWADFGCVNLGSRTYPLSGNLHQTELGERQHIVLGSILVHKLLHIFEEVVPVLSRRHVDEVHNDYSSHITQAQLTRNLFRSNTVHLIGVFFLVGSLGTYSAIHVYHVQGFRCFDDKVGSLLHRHHLSERALDLSVDLKMIKNRLLALV